VVGAGYTGLAAALELARRGRHVVVLDRRRPASEASSRNGGMVHPGVKLDLARLLARPGGERLWRSCVEAFEGVERLVAQTGADCAWDRTGHVELARHRRHARHLHHVAAAYAEVGEEAHVLEGDDLGAEIGSPCFEAGLVVTRSAALHPARFAAGLLESATAAGAEVHGEVTALSIEGHPGGPGGAVVRTGTGALRAGEVVMATNGTTDRRLVPWLGRRVLRIGSFIIATEALGPDVARSVSPRGRMFFDTRNLLNYWRLSPDGSRLLFGGRTSLAATTVEQARDRLYRAMVEVHPQLAGVRVERAWGGPVALTADRMPHVGRHRGSGVVYAMGYCGTGIALSTSFGTAVGRWLCGQGELPAFAGLAWPRVPAPSRLPGALAAAGWWFRARDALGY